MSTTQQTPAGLTRRGFVSLGIGALVVGSFPLALWRRRQVARRSMPVMGTIADVVVLHRSTTIAQAAIDAALAELRRVERLMTRFSTESDIGRANRASIAAPIVVSPDTALVVGEALRWAGASNGAYDPAVGTAVELWDVTNRQEPPEAARVAALAGRHLYHAIEVGSFRGEAVLVRRDADARFDLGGIAKGYGVDRAIAVLREWGITGAVVDVGGDLYALGGPDGDGWRVGIQSPDSATEVARVFSLCDGAVATSGTYAQFFRHRERRYHHLLDPKTAAPRSTSVRSFTVHADSCMHADVAATACFGMSDADAAVTLGRCEPGARVVSTI